MSKTTDASFAEEVGVDTYPALVFFKDGVPNLYEGDLGVEEEVLDWLTEMKVESHIELITRPMLETMVEETQYLAVFFCEFSFTLFRSFLLNTRTTMGLIRPHKKNVYLPIHFYTTVAIFGVIIVKCKSDTKL